MQTPQMTQPKTTLIYENNVAGGFDAIFAIVLSPTARSRVEALWESWKEMPVLPLILREETKGLAIDPVPECVCISRG
jgi:hypothetical protein